MTGVVVLEDVEAGVVDGVVDEDEDTFAASGTDALSLGDGDLTPFIIFGEVLECPLPVGDRLTTEAGLLGALLLPSLLLEVSYGLKVTGLASDTTSAGLPAVLALLPLLAFTSPLVLPCFSASSLLLPVSAPI